MNNKDRRETIRFSESCRLCLRKPGMYNVFKIKGLMLDIYEFTGVKVFISGDLPQTICRECSDLLLSVKKLKEIATANDAHMRSLVSDKLASSKQIEEVFLKEDPLKSNCDENNDQCFIKTENETDGKAVADDGSCTPLVAVRTDLYSTVKTEPNSDTQEFLNHTEGNTIKTEPTNDNIESMYDFESSLITDACSQWNPPVFPDDKPRSQSRELYRCETCAKDFMTWKKFYYHNRFHNKSMECVVVGCPKKFATRGDLEKHMRTHTGEKPYQCELCSRRFTQKGTLKVHRVMVHSLNKDVIVGM